jgi:hypothetical protein
VTPPQYYSYAGVPKSFLVNFRVCVATYCPTTPATTQASPDLQESTAEQNSSVSIIGVNKIAPKFVTEIFHLLVEQTNLYYEQFLDQQAGPSHRLPEITLPDMMTFIALALQMGHILKDALHDYWSRIRQLFKDLTARRIYMSFGS